MHMAKNSSKVVALRAVLGANIKAVPRVVRRTRLKEPKWRSVKFGLWVRLEARPGKENELADFLRAALSLVQQESNTATWFALRLGKSTFAIFDAFADETSREEHLAGPLVAALKEKYRELLAKAPVVEKID